MREINEALYSGLLRGLQQLQRATVVRRHKAGGGATRVVARKVNNNARTGTGSCQTIAAFKVRVGNGHGKAAGQLRSAHLRTQ